MSYLAVWLPGLALQAAGGGGPNPGSGSGPSTVWERQGAMELVIGANRAARAAGVRAGMAVAEAQGRCAGLRLYPRDANAEQQLTARLLEEVGRISPRVQAVGNDTVVVDCTGVRRLRGTAEQAGARLVKSMKAAGWMARFGTGGHATAALLAVRSGLGRIAPGEERNAIAGLPVGAARAVVGDVGVDVDVEDALQVLEQWGVRRLGELAALEAVEVAARLGAAGVALHQVARGLPVERFTAAAERNDRLACQEGLDPPVRDGQLIQAAVERAVARLGAEMERRDRVAEHGRLQLQVERGQAAVYERAFAAPTRERRSLVAQLLHAIELQPPRGAVERVELALRLARTRRVQGDLFAAFTGRGAVEAEKTARLLERLGAIWEGEAGTVRRVDTHRKGMFEMGAFAPAEAEEQGPAAAPRLALRRWRPARRWEPGTGEIVNRAGPWRSEGGWWREGNEHWSEDEWDVEIRFPDRQQSGLYRLRHDLEDGSWFITGQYD